MIAHAFAYVGAVAASLVLVTGCALLLAAARWGRDGDQ